MAKEFVLNVLPEDNAAPGPPIHFKDIFKYPLMVIFFAFLVVFTAVDMLKPTQEMSELENRKLQQAPAFTLSSLVNNEWTVAYGEFTRDQFLLRDGWVSLQSGLEVAQGKLELGGVWLAQDGYQIANNRLLSSGQKRLIPLNTEVVSSFAQQYPGKVSVMVVPSPANVLSDKLRWSPPQMDENSFLDTMFSDMQKAGAKVIDLRESFFAMETAGQQIYYHTDHHWTTTGGARTAYEAYCAAMGRSVASPASSLLRQQPGFYGTNYAKTKLPGTQAEMLDYYDFPNPITIYKPQADGSIGENTTTMMDKEKLAQYDKYAAFLHGNNGFTLMQGNGQGSILVIKDSYGNSFVPYLVESYATIGVIDLRDWTEPHKTIAEHGFDEILVLYSFASFSEDTYVVRLGSA